MALRLGLEIYNSFIPKALCNYRRPHWACWPVSSKIFGRRLRRGSFRSFFHNITFFDPSLKKMDRQYYKLVCSEKIAQKSVYFMLRPVVGIPLCVYERVRL